jgi:hypothetical protein
MPYDDSLATERDRARSLLGDTANDPATELVTDAHIAAAQARYGFAGGVAFVALGLAARFAQQPGSVRLPNGLSATWAERVAYWQGLAAQLRTGGVTGPPAVAPYAGGLTRTDKQQDAANPDRVQPAFRRDLQGDPTDTPPLAQVLP